MNKGLFSFNKFVLAVLIFILNVSVCSSSSGQHEEITRTKWGETVTAGNAWQKYPRPQMKREKWTNLNGLWDYAITEKKQAKPIEWDGEILIPFALEAPLSGVGKKLEPDQALWYRRTFKLSKIPEERLLLHFEAVDYETVVWVNGKKVGAHVGGNLPFSFEISDHVQKGSNELVLCVLDRTDASGSYQLRGKQVLDNKAIFYTRVSGIWQTVWMEPVPGSYIEGIRIHTDMNGKLTVLGTIGGRSVKDMNLRVTASFDGRPVSTSTAEGQVELQIKNPKLWSPDAPNLYDLKVELLDSRQRVVDAVASYAGLRQVGKVKDADGNWRFTLNGEIIFHWGTLDQGWWPDGLLTPPSEKAMVSDINFLKEAGFNMIRKHIKVEPRRYYYDCDRLGMLLWQDQVSGGVSPEWIRLPDSKSGSDAVWPEAEHVQWMNEFKGMVDHLWNHPSIVVWTPFNECWGQHQTREIGNWISDYDPSRLVNIASGGNFFPVGDIADDHSYPHPSFPLKDSRYCDFVKVVGEFGGHGWPVDDHLWMKKEGNWGYGGLPKTQGEYVERYRESIRVLSELKKNGIAAGVYTQTTDVEVEVNGLLTYDRKVMKIPARKLNKIYKESGLTD